ncbi:MAG: hypothetical protein KBG00_10940 [Rhodoferax sp.]|uniref:hypothetical protein n=1 Tax=Rhodoferax sp. TaxID=50421 RepID=UPI001B60A616|nr:hypothetical protein [Rhodoferax sp.]MBP9149285.1 hypothetical protein [Rhodoferax sp.]MBP9737065.1 hypothetical protein [Rhodoferax sp.]
MICKDKSGQIRLDSDKPLTPQGFIGPMQQVVLELKIYREQNTHDGRAISVWGM